MQTYRRCVGMGGKWHVIEPEDALPVLWQTCLHRSHPLKRLVPAPAMAKLHRMTQC